jgi:signal transduction histidine kinase
LELAVYRIVQEAVNNVARHAQATRCEVRLELHNARDNGKDHVVDTEIDSTETDS